MKAVLDRRPHSFALSDHILVYNDKHFVEQIRMKRIIRLRQVPRPLITSPSPFLEVGHLKGWIIVCLLLQYCDPEAFQLRIVVPVARDVPYRKIAILKMQYFAMSHDPAVPYFGFQVLVDDTATSVIANELACERLRENFCALAADEVVRPEDLDVGYGTQLARDGHRCRPWWEDMGQDLDDNFSGQVEEIHVRSA